MMLKRIQYLFALGGSLTFVILTFNFVLIFSVSADPFDQLFVIFFM